MYMKKILAISFVILMAVLTTIANVEAAGSLTVSPSRVSPNGVVTITFTSTGDSLVKRIEVEAPDGTVYTKEINEVLSDGETLQEEFGSGISGWTPNADTSDDGWYHVEVIGADGQFLEEDYFDVSRQFYVPEFATITAVITAIGFSAYLLTKRRIKMS